MTFDEHAAVAHAQSVAGFVAHFRAKPAYGQVEVASAVGLLRLWRESLRGTHKESRKCPSCHGGRGHYLAKGSNDLGSKRPDVARQLQPDLSGGLRAEGPRPRRRHGVVARRVRSRLSDGRPRQGEGQAGLLPVLLREEAAREADKARLALGPSARGGIGEAGRCLLPIRHDLANIGLNGYAWRL